VLVAVGAAEVRVTVETAAMTVEDVRRSARLVGSEEKSMFGA
jgi:tetrahydromethanopterin S-methyltransferase subunit F